MKLVPCPNCGFKNFPENQRCSSCNELLLNASVPRTSQKTSPSSTNKTVVVSNSKSHTTPTPPAPIPSPGSTRSPVPYNPPSHTSSPVPYHPSPTSPMSSSPSPILPPNPLPKYMTRWGPCTVEGVVVDVGQMQNVDGGIKPGDVIHYGLSSILLVTKPVYGIMSFASGARRPKEYKTIYTLRVQTPANEFIDVRIERDMKGASINLRDYISIWGKSSAGVIIMIRGYNHTVKGEISLR